MSIKILTNFDILYLVFCTLYGVGILLVYLKTQKSQPRACQSVQLCNLSCAPSK